jgi:hypothetical protein
LLRRLSWRVKVASSDFHDKAMPGYIPEAVVLELFTDGKSLHGNTAYFDNDRTRL